MIQAKITEQTGWSVSETDVTTAGRRGSEMAISSQPSTCELSASRISHPCAGQLGVHGAGRDPAPSGIAGVAVGQRTVEMAGHHRADAVGANDGIRVTDRPVGQPDLLAPDAFGAEVGVLGADAPGLRERRVRQFPQRQGGEFQVNPGVVHAA